MVQEAISVVICIHAEDKRASFMDANFQKQSSPPNAVEIPLRFRCFGEHRENGMDAVCDEKAS